MLVLFLNNLIIDITTSLELVNTIYGPVHEILIRIVCVHVYAQKPPINVHADISREARRLIFGLSFVYAQEPDVRSSYHLYSLKTKRSQCHYVMTS